MQPVVFKKPGGIFALLLILGLLFPAAASAFVPQAPHLFYMMTKKLGRAKTLRVEQVVEIPPYRPAESAGKEALVETTLLREVSYYAFPGRYRSLLTSEGESRDHLFLPEGSATLIAGERVEGIEASMDRYKALILLRNRKVLLRYLTLAGVGVEVTSLGRFQGGIHYVVGARPSDETSPQVWVDRETLLPSRWITGEHGLEIRYMGWRKFGKAWYPREIRFLVGGKVVRRILVESVIEGKPVPESLFRLDTDLVGGIGDMELFLYTDDLAAEEGETASG